MKSLFAMSVFIIGLLFLVIPQPTRAQNQTSNTHPNPHPNPNPGNSPEVARGYQQNQQQYYGNRNNQPSTQQLWGSHEARPGQPYTVAPAQEH
jgi:hypothetical protein